MMNASINKPCVNIKITPHPGYKQKLREVQAGMEEENIPGLVVECDDHDITAIAYQGACSSQLGVGVGIGEAGMCIHYHKLPEGQPLFLSTTPGTLKEWRHFGSNAARLVKGIPFKEPVTRNNMPLTFDDGLVDLLRNIIARVLQENAQTAKR